MHVLLINLVKVVFGNLLLINVDINIVVILKVIHMENVINKILHVL